MKENPNVGMIPFDLSNAHEIGVLVQKIGGVDILINNAGIMYSVSYRQYSQEQMGRIMNINLYAPIELIKHTSEYMIKAGSGRIVSTASSAGQIAHPDIWYGISKAGLINATKNFANLLACYRIS